MKYSRLNIFLITATLFFFSSKEITAQTNVDQNTYFNLAQNYELAGQLDKAEQIYRELFDKQNTNYIYFDALYKILIKQKKYEESIALLQTRINQVPQDVNMYGLLGSTYFMMDDISKASEAWEKGIAANPANIIGYRVIANYAIENRAFEKAIDILERGKKISPDPTVFSYDLANIFTANMRWADAANEYCNILKKHTDQTALIKTRIGNSLTSQGAVEPITRIVEKFADENDIPQFLDLLSFIYTSTGKYDEALPLTVKYDKATANTGDYIFVFAQDANRNRKYDIAAKAFKYLIDNYPTSKLLPIAKIGFANNYAENINFKYSSESDEWKPFKEKVVTHKEEYLSAIQAYARLTKEFPNNAVYPQALYKMAMIYSENLLDFQKADSLFTIINSNHPLTNYSILSFIERGKLAIVFSRFDDAQTLFKNVLLSKKVEPNEISEANYYLARIEFWKGNFSQSLILFRNVTKDMSADFSNDALELSSLISTSKKDSISLIKYAQADLYSFQNKFENAAIEFKTLAENPNLFILNEFANYKLAEMLIAKNDLTLAIQTLEILSEDPQSSIFADKSLFLLAKTYQFGKKDIQKAVQNYQKLLEKFPDSLYFDRARDLLKDFKTNNG
jgi:tetratricopeptide (TPR) repeat protein